MKRKRLKRILLSAAAALLVLVTTPLMLGCCVFSAPRYQGPRTAHFDGKQFHNRAIDFRKRNGGFWKWMFTREKGEWPKWIDAEPGPPPPEHVGPGDLRVTFVNHATLLIQMDGLNILTDPIWSDRCSPLSWIGPKRVRVPGIRYDDLPPIDVVLISHNHYDHLDLPTLRRLARDHRPRIYTGLGNTALLEQEGIRGGTALDWWDTRPLNDDVEVVFVPSQHWSGRGTCDRQATLWGSFVLKSEAGNVYFAGDTGFGPHFQDVADRYGPFRLAALPIGAYLPRWFMAPAHVSPEEAVEASRVLKAAVSVPVHYGTFQIADDAYTQPLSELEAGLNKYNIPNAAYITAPASDLESASRHAVAMQRGGAASESESLSQSLSKSDSKTPSESGSRLSPDLPLSSASPAASPFWILDFGEGRDVPPLTAQTQF